MNTQKEQPKHGKDDRSGKSSNPSKSNSGSGSNMAPGKSSGQPTKKESKDMPQNPDKDKNRENNW